MADCEVPYSVIASGAVTDNGQLLCSLESKCVLGREREREGEREREREKEREGGRKGEYVMYLCL